MSGKNENEMMKQWEPLVIKLSAMWCSTNEHIEMDDMQQMARIGLMKAIRTYVESRGAFSTYAYRCIQTEMRELLRAEGRAKRRNDRRMVPLPEYELPDKSVAWEEPEMDRVYAALSELTFNERYIIGATSMRGIAAIKASKEIGIPKSTGALARATGLAKMREILVESLAA